MLRVYENDEIPKGYRDALKYNSIDINEIKYIAIPDDDFKDAWEFIGKITDHFALLSTITEQYFYAIYYE